MESKPASRPFLPIVMIFIIVSLFSLAFREWLAGRKVDARVLLFGNGVLFLATAISFYLYNKALRHANVQYFLRMLYGSLLVKMVLCMGVTLLYLFLSGGVVSKYAILLCFGLYILYTFAEVKILMRLSKLKKNA